MQADNDRSNRYDAVVIGGALSGSSVATLLHRWAPDARVLIVETSERFDRKVGEATVEISGRFLRDILGAGDLLQREHLEKHGLRYWFSTGSDTPLARMSEVGTWERPVLPSFQLDRARLDESLLERSVEAGVELERPAKITAVELGWPVSKLVLETAAGTRAIEARWVLDASGRQAFLARRARALRTNDEHPITALWGRWRGVRDVDRQPYETSGTVFEPRGSAPRMEASRRLATNHFCGHGYWCWMIPLAGGDTSVGLVYDRRHFAPPQAASARESYEEFLRTEPGARELMRGAELDAGDFRSYKQLSYSAERYMDRGWALIGDAASFLDPFYSPGLDHVAQSAYATARLVAAELTGRLDESALPARIEAHNELFRANFERTFDALYRDKYEVMGDAELMAAAYLLDTSMYYLGLVEAIYAHDEEFATPGIGKRLPRARMAYRFMRAYNRRLVRLARARRRLGVYGRRNEGWRLLHGSFRLERDAKRFLALGLRVWIGAELATLRARFTPRARRVPGIGRPLAASLEGLSRSSE